MESLRKQMGFLKIKNDCYPIYEGANILGRDLNSTVTMKDMVFSKQHAFIGVRVGDDENHFICDLNSSNGTHVRNTKLIPYKFYTINDSESITFGNIQTMYFKGTESKQYCADKGSTSFVSTAQDLNNDGPTQILSSNNIINNIHDLDTQPNSNTIHEISSLKQCVDSNGNENIHLQPTQKVNSCDANIINFHDLPTQVFLPEIDNIHEAATQVCNYSLIENISSSNRNDKELEKEENTSAALTIDQSDDSTHSFPENISACNITDNEPEIEQNASAVLTTDKSDDSTQDCDDLSFNESFRLSLQKSMTEAEAKMNIEVDETILIESQKEVKKDDQQKNKVILLSDSDDDIILSTQVSEMIDKKYQEHQDQINVKPINTIQIDEDSDATDVEEDLLIVKTVASMETTSTTVELETKNRNNENVHDSLAAIYDSDEEIDLLAPITKLDSSSTENYSSETLHTTEKIDNAQKVSIQYFDHDYTTALPENNEENAIKSVNKPSVDTHNHLTTNENTDDIFLLPTQVSKFSVNEVDVDNTDDKFIAPTQILHINSSSNNDCKEDTSKDDPFIASTQILNLNSSNNSCQENVDNDDKFIAPTQILNLNSSNDSKENMDNNDEFIAPTQILNLSSCSKENIDNDDAFVAPTQVLNFSSSTDNKNKYNKVIDVEDAPTQILHLNDNFCIETQKLKENDNELTEILMEPRHEFTTNGLDNNGMRDEFIDDNFLIPTQKLNDTDNENSQFTPKCSLDSDTKTDISNSISNNESTDLRFNQSAESEEVSMRLHLSETEDSLLDNSKKEQYLSVKTNILSNNLDEKGDYETEIKNTSIHEAETQLEVDFSLQAQKVYIEKETRRPDNPLAHMFAEEETQMTEEQTKGHEYVQSQTQTISAKSRLIPVLTLVDIKNSIITLRDRQEASTSKIKKPYIKIKRNKQEPTRRSYRNKIDSQTSITKDSKTENMESTDDSDDDDSSESKSKLDKELKEVEKKMLKEEEEQLKEAIRLSLEELNKSDLPPTKREKIESANQVDDINKEYSKTRKTKTPLTWRHLQLKHKNEKSNDESKSPVQVDEIIKNIDKIDESKKSHNEVQTEETSVSIKKTSIVEKDQQFNVDKKHVTRSRRFKNVMMRKEMNKNEESTDGSDAEIKLRTKKSKKDHVDKIIEDQDKSKKSNDEIQNGKTDDVSIDTKTESKIDKIDEIYDNNVSKKPQSNTKTRRKEIINDSDKLISVIAKKSSQDSISEINDNQVSIKKSNEDIQNGKSSPINVEKRKKPAEVENDNKKYSSRITRLQINKQNNTDEMKESNIKPTKTSKLKEALEGTQSRKHQSQSPQLEVKIEKFDSIDEMKSILMNKNKHDSQLINTNSTDLDSESPNENKDFNRSHNTRGKRISNYKYLSTGQFERPKEIEEKKSELTEKSKSLSQEKNDDLKIDVKDSKISTKRKISADVEDLAVKRLTRSKNSKQIHSQTITEHANCIVIEDSDDSSNSSSVERSTKRTSNRIKNIISSNSNMNNIVETPRTTKVTNSNNQIIVPQTPRTTKVTNSNNKIIVPQTPRTSLSTKRTLRHRQNSIFESENKKKQTDIYLETPSTKRRRNEPPPLDIIRSKRLTTTSNKSNDDSIVKHNILFTMLNDPSLETIAKKLGGNIIDSINTCTVLVTNKISRSLKFLNAVSLGIPIVYSNWIKDSEKHKKFLDPWDYILEDVESEKKFNMSLKESLRKSQTKKLLSGETILLAVNKNFDILKELIETSGGTCIRRLSARNEKAIVVSYEDEKSKYSKYLKNNSLTVVSTEAIFCGILQQNINWKQYLLS